MVCEKEAVTVLELDRTYSKARTITASAPIKATTGEALEPFARFLGGIATMDEIRINQQFTRDKKIFRDAQPLVNGDIIRPGLVRSSSIAGPES
jgi:hypothetical protein